MEDTLTGMKRRAQGIVDIVARTGIDQTMVERVVPRFYEEIRSDELSSPNFEARITGWEPHLRRMWES